MKIIQLSLFYILLGIAISLGLLIHHASHDAVLLSLVSMKIESYLKDHYQLRAKLSIQQCNIFGLEVIVNTLAISPLRDESWSINLDSLKLTCSLADSLKKLKPIINVILDGLLVSSRYEDHLPSLLECYNNISFGGSQWYALHMIGIHHAIYRCDYPQGYLKGFFEADVRMDNHNLQAECNYTAGECNYAKKECIRNVHGKATFKLDLTSMTFEALLKGSLNIPMLPSCIGAWNYQARYLNKQGIITLSTPNAAMCLQIAPLIIYPKGCTAHLTSFIFLDKFFYLSSLVAFNGMIKTQAKISFNDHQWRVQGSLLAKDLSIANISPYDIALNVDLDKSKLEANCTYKNDNHTYCYQLQGDTASNMLTVIPQFQDSIFNKLVIKTNDWLLPQTLFVFHELHQSSVARVDIPYGQPIRATLDYQLIRPLLEHYTGYKLLGSNTMTIQLEPHAEVCDIAIHSKGNIYVPIIYNVIRSLQANMQAIYASQRLAINHIQLLLEKGSIMINDAYLAWKDTKEPTFLHIPMKFSNIFASQTKYAYAWLSGELTFDKQQNSSTLQGELRIDKSSFHANPFSKALQKTLQALFESSYKAHRLETDLHIQIHTVQPITIKTPVIKALVDAHVAINGTSSSPLISGVLSIRQGELLFAYKPLSLISGHITLLPHRHHDPLIEFIARGSIRRYQVTIHCQGSLNNPQLYLSSTPSLSQEQIVTLLMTGSPEGSLGLVMPSFILNNLHTLLFDEQEQLSSTQQYVKTILSPLRYVKFVPHFADQSARGGFRGSIEVDVGNSLRATLKKNFSLLEDTKIEVEYTLSDEVTIRALKDERGDLGGEIEMCFKF